MITVLDKNGTMLGSQSGFFLDDRTLVTALHGVLDAEKLTASTSKASDIPVSISTVDEQRDIALLSIDEQAGSPVFQVAVSLPDIGDPITVQPPGSADRNNTVPGRVICIREDLVAGLQIVTSVEIELGMSGSPALDTNNHVIGVLTDAEDVNGRLLAQLAPSTAITALARLRGDPLRHLPDPPRPSSDDFLRRAMLLAFMARDASVAGETLREQSLLRQSVALAPTFWKARYALTVSYLTDKKYDEAAGVLSTWVTNDDVAYIRDYLQACTERLRDNPEASISHYEKSIERRPTVTALGELAAVCAQLDRKDQAAALVAKAHALCPLDDRPLLVMYNTALADGRLDDAVHAAEDLVSRSWTSSSRVLRARALMNARHSVRAADVLRTDVVEWPDEPELRTSLAAALLNLGKEAEAVDVLEDCVKTSPSNPQAWFMLGSIYDVKKEGELAIIAYQRARELNGTNPKILYNLGLAYIREHKMAEARETMEALRPIDAHGAKKLESLLDARRGVLDLQLQK